MDDTPLLGDGDQAEGGEKKQIKEKSELSTRWLVLFLASTAMIGSYYAYDIPAALHSQLEDHMGKPSNYETMFNLLYTVYSLPNIPLPFVSGFFVDKYGPRICLVVFASFILAGQVVFALGVSAESFPIMLIGRTIFGLGGESLTVAQSAIMADWFRGKELAFAFGFNLSIARLGSVVNNLVSPGLASDAGVSTAVWFGALLCGVSLAACLIFVPIDRAVSASIARAKEEQIAEEAAPYDENYRHTGRSSDRTKLLMANGEPEDEEEEFADDAYTDDGMSSKGKRGNSDSVDLDGFEDAPEFPHPVPHHPDNHPGEDDEDLIPAEAVRARSLSVSIVHDEPGDANAVRLADVKTFGVLFWVLVISCIVVYGCILPFNSISSAFLQERDYFQDPQNKCQLEDKYRCQGNGNHPIHCPSSDNYKPPLPHNVTVDKKEYDPLDESDIDCSDDDWNDKGTCTYRYCERKSNAEGKAALVMSIPYVTSGVLSPFLGYVVDKVGMRAIVATIAPVVLIVVHTLLGFSDISPIPPLVGQGLAYTAFAAVLWPSVPFTVPEKLTGLAFGVVTAVQNLGLALFPLCVAGIYSANDDEYIPYVPLFFVVLACIGTGAGIAMNWYDYRGGWVLNSASQPKEEDSSDDAVQRERRKRREEYNSKEVSASLNRDDEDEEVLDYYNPDREDNIRPSNTLRNARDVMDDMRRDESKSREQAH